MDPALVSVIIQPDRTWRRLPKVGEMVRMRDRKGLFLVLSVNRQERLADLTQRVGRDEVVIENVPFNLIRNVPRRASRAIHNFLHS